MRQGLFGGTFDPIHNGHLILAQELHSRLGLDKVWFIPTGTPWMKAEKQLSAKEHRLAMVKLAIEGNENFSFSSLEMDRPGPTYTIDTLHALTQSAMKGDELLFIMGADTLAFMHRWKAIRQVLMMMNFVLVPRAGQSEIDLSALEKIDSEAASRFTIVDTPRIEISGTELRSRVAENVSLRYLVPRSVEEYIWKHQLYR